MRDFRWLQIFMEGEGASGGQGDQGGSSGGSSGAGGGEGGGQALSLRAQLASQLDEGERGGFSKWADTYTDDKSFVLGAFNMRQQFDARVPVPAKDAKPEEFDKFYQRVGKPPEAKAYKYERNGEDGKPIKLADADQARLEAWKEHVHKYHYTQEQFDGGVKFFEEDSARQEQATIEMLDHAQDSSAKAMKAKWGPDYELNLAAAKDGGLAFAPSEQDWEAFVNLPVFMADGKQIKIGDHPTFLETFAKIGRATAEDTRVRNLNTSGEASTIKDAIGAIEQEAIKAGKSTASEPYFSKLRDLHKKLNNNTPMSGTGRPGFGV